MKRWSSLWTLFGVVLLSLGAWNFTRSWKKSAFAALSGILFSFAKKVWDEIEPKWAQRVGTWLDESIMLRVQGYESRYRQLVLYRNRTFDVKGFTTQGKFALDLEPVYIKLSVDPAAPNSILQDLAPRIAPRNEVPHDIFTWLKRDSVFLNLSRLKATFITWFNSRPLRLSDLWSTLAAWLSRPETHRQHLAIIGPPGSGKTTMMKYLALITASRRSTLRCIPILLYIRDHADAMVRGASFLEVITSSLKESPPPESWLKRKLKRGRCLVMFDGLDEVADGPTRRRVAQWIEEQSTNHGANRFLISSRPNGYRRTPLSGFTVLRVLPFDIRQVDRFVQNWYLANELAAFQKDDTGVRIEATRGAEDLMRRLRSTPTLLDLAVNPLLLTLIATVHRFRSQLPGRRVELFSEICDVFLGNRQQAKGIELNLTPAQKIRVLRVLAYHMMCRQLREVTIRDASRTISESLRLVSPTSLPEEFLSMIEDSSGLILQRENGIYAFAHLIFQEYLASVHIKEDQLVASLVENVGESWWYETLRLYAAQGDASPIVARCLNDYGHIRTEELLLAMDCAEEGLELREDLRNQLFALSIQLSDDADIERQRVSRQHILSRRLRNMLRIDVAQSVDRTPITHAEYQVFIDDMRSKGHFVQPDHWTSYEGPVGSSKKPIVGIRYTDAIDFCEWLTSRDQEGWIYSLASAKTICDFKLHDPEKDGFQCYQLGGVFPQAPVARDVFHQIREDMWHGKLHPDGDSGRADRRMALFIIWLRLAQTPTTSPLRLSIGSAATNSKGLRIPAHARMTYALDIAMAYISDRSLRNDGDGAFPISEVVKNLLLPENLSSAKDLIGAYCEDKRQIEIFQDDLERIGIAHSELPKQLGVEMGLVDREHSAINRDRLGLLLNDLVSQPNNPFRLRRTRLISPDNQFHASEESPFLPSNSSSKSETLASFYRKRCAYLLHWFVISELHARTDEHQFTVWIEKRYDHTI
jgi:hypothetical protein